MRKQIFKSGFFLKCLMVLLAIVASINSAQADTYYRIKIVPVLENGATGKGFAIIKKNNDSYYNYPGKITKENLWQENFNQMMHQLDDESAKFYIFASPGDEYSDLVGWYWDEECSQPITQMTGFCKYDVYNNQLGRTFPSATSEGDAPEYTFYAKFSRLPESAFDWVSLRATTLVSGKKYYIYSPLGRFLKAPSTSTTSVGDATVFTFTYDSHSSESNSYFDGTSKSFSYDKYKISYTDGAQTKYVRTSSSWSTSSYACKLMSQTNNRYCIVENYSLGYANHIQVNLDGSIVYKTYNAISRGNGIYWIFIPEDDVLELAHVNSLNENGSETITSSPTGQGTAYVKFNVSATSVPTGFTYTLSGADASNWVLGSATCNDGILSVPVTYTAKNKHYTSTPASTVTVTVKAKNDETNTASGTASAYVDFEPRFALAVDELDWSRVGAEVVETFYLGQEIAASQRDRLANKLVKNDSQTTGVAANNATWTATITGTNANQFKFANGTQTVTGPYSANLLDVHYAPTTTGNHTATLHIVTSYTDANSHTETYERDITLKGVGSAASRITFTKSGSQLPTAEESYNFGNIIGTNQQEITANLFISQITNPQMEWDDAGGQFVFVNKDDVNWSLQNQTLTFRAKRTSPVEVNTVHTATLTVSGKGTANEDVSATITLTYTALPLIQTTVTWNWGTIKENSTVNTPITTNSDGAWTLEKSVGDMITYDGSAKTATVPYLHHEPGVSAEFVLNIPQTDTYTALDSAFEAIVVPILPKHVYITRQADLGDHNSGTDGEYGKVKHWSSSYETWYDDTKTLQVKGDDIWFYVNGRTKFEFDFTGNVGWSIKELDKNGGTISSLLGQSFATGHNVLSVSPQTATLLLHGNGSLSNIHFYEYDTIAADFNNIALVDNGSTISNKVITATFANKRQVTAYLNATAAQYFTIATPGKDTGSSMVFDSNDGLGLGFAQDKVFTVALKTGANADEARAATAGNACQLIFADDYTYNHEVVSLPIVIIEPCEITYKHSANGSYTFTYQKNGLTRTVDNADSTKSITTNEAADYVVTLSAPTPASNYQFQGWKINGTLVSCKETFTTSIGVTGSQVEVEFVPTETQNYRVGDVYFANLEAAISAANTSSDSKVVTPMQDITLGDGTTPVNYTIPAGVTLLIPHKADFFELQQTPDLVNVNSDDLELAQKLSAYRTLTLKEGVTITCNGTICVAGNMVTANGGRKSAYPTGEVGLINMVHGGHIELNNGANLYCWGYIKGQDMDQGNNTVGTGTVTANAGSIVWENFELGDWRGGSASLDIYNNTEGRKLFPFQSYAIQNIEIPTTFKFGSFLKNYTSITTGYGNHGAVFSMIGPAETMFLLTDEDSKVRTWYDATTDLTCYELSGTAQLDALHITVYVSMSSENYNLPISNSMHIILTNCDMTLAKPMMVQAGAVVEIKKDAIVNLTDNLFLYDVDQWGKYAHNYYFRSFNNITSHKDRGAENSKAGLDDAKLIVDGILNVNKDDEHNTVGKIYATKGGANVMGNNGGVINFNTTLPDSAWLWAVEVKSGIPYIEWVRNRVYAANLCNEDCSYTPSTGYETYYNIHGRWFRTDLKDINDDHTYTFEYKTTNTSTEIIDTLAIYSHDKTGLTERMKWFNVEADENCENWWVGANPAALYNHTMLGEWHQFIATETENVYSGSNNMLYQKDACEWVETGAVDENCLYTFEEGGNLIKKALVDGHFIPLTSNGYDPAYYHEENEVKTYYICFQGCNWHEATPYVGESKAYTIHPEDVDLHYIWFNNDWMNVLRDEPFFYTEDEQTNVRTYYEYVNGEWEIATPYVSVTDAAETRTFYMIKEAFNVASIKKNATITLLRDLPNVSERLSFETQNTTCTLDLNGHLLGGNIANLVTVNAPGATFTITDNSALTSGKISNAANKAVYVQKGTLVVTKGTIESTSTYAIDGATTTAITINGGYFAAGTQCAHTTGTGTCSISGGHFNKNAGLASYAVAHKYPFETTDPKYKYEVSDAWTITFLNGETTLQELHLKPGETPVYTANEPTQENQHFTGWSPEVVAATADATYTAQFEAIPASTSRVTLNSNGGNEGLQYVYVTTGSAVGTLPQTTKEGNTFAGWFTDPSAGTQVSASTTVSADVTWYAHYTVNQYTLTWNANGGVLSGSYTSGLTNCGASITKPTATFEGHTFIGWYVTPATTMPAHDVTYTAQWSIAAKHYKQNLADDDYTLDLTENVTGEVNAYVTPAVKTYDGFISPAAQTVKIGETTEVTYNYARRTYTITLDVPEGSICETASVDVKHGATIETLPVATMTGRAFLGWFTKATGGDQITNETVIQRNIGTLYAQFSEVNMNVTAPTTISDTREVTDLRITTTGKLTITGNVTVTNFILESNGETASGQFVAGHADLHATNAYFDLKLNTPARHWHAFGVPWAIGNLDDVKLIADGTPLTLGRDYDIIWYDGAERATNGPGTNCWKYVEHNGKTLTPGVGYMIAFTRAVNKVRFTKASGEPILYNGSVTLQAAGEGTNKGINAVANPMVYHANMSLNGVGQVHDGGEIGSDGYSEVTISGMNYIVGKTVYVQVDAEQTISVANSKISPAAAPVRRAARATDKKYLTLEDYYTVSLTNANGIGNKLYVLPEEDKENKYVIGHDLVKMGMSTKKPQIWIKRYGANLGLNTTAPMDGVTEFPVNIYAPKAGQYTLSLVSEPDDEYTVYLTLNGEAIWNLSSSEYAVELAAGTNKSYGLRLSARKSPSVATGVDEAVVDAQGEIKKVIINDKVFIIRGDQVYSIDGQLVK